MKPIQTWLKHGLYALSLVAVSATVTFAQGPAAPGPEHAELKRLEGQWKATIKSPDGGDSSGTATYKMECGGLWLASDFKADFGGMAFHGRGMDSYDAAKKKYVSVWVDSMSTQPMLFEGTMDKEKKVLTMVGEGPGPDGNKAKWRSESHFVDADHMTFAMYVTGSDGKETKMMTIEYARQK